MNKIIDLPSGAKLEIQVAPFLDSKELYQVFLQECKEVRIDTGDFGVEQAIKDLFCVALSSKKLEAALVKCFGRVLYNNTKIDKDTFEPLEARGDYVTVCLEVARENILPFTQSLFAKYKEALGALKEASAKAQGSASPTTAP